jgi:hypothetical protein
MSEQKTTTHDIENVCTGLRQAHKYGRVNLVNGIPVLPFFIIGSPPTKKHIIHEIVTV